MGISGLLPLLRSITRRVHIETLAGQAVAVDAYSWLHKGVFMCANDLFHSRPTNGYVEYCMSKIKMLKQHNIRPILVFDGAPLPMKAGKESSRLKSREDSRLKAHEYLKKGDHKAAATHIHKSIDVTPEMAHRLILELKRSGIDFVVAPYEADAQMAFLDLIGEVAAIITEDSDMILFGCKKIMYKLDRHGFADEVNLEQIGENTDIELSGFTLERFRQMCILSGCDYLDAINGFGLKTCHKYFVKYKTADRVLQAIRAEFPAKVPADFEKMFAKAELTFCHQRVYDHRCQGVTHLHPISEEFILSLTTDDYGTWEFVGPHVECSLAKGIATGFVNPITKEPFVREEVVEESQESLVSVSHQPPRKILKSRFFKSISKEEHAEQTQKRLTIPSRSLDLKENTPLGVVASYPTAMARKRFSTSSRTLEQEMAANKIPTFLYTQKQPSETSKDKPLRLDASQRTLGSFFHKTQ